MKDISAFLLDSIKGTMVDNNFDYESYVNSLGHMKDIELRKQGKEFSFSEHISGLVFSLLSNQRVWEPIEKNMDNIYEIFYNFDKNKILDTNPVVFEEKLKGIKCGNIAIKRQMAGLHYNIIVLEELETEYGSLDKFVVSDTPFKIAKILSEGKYKLKQVGYALALEYLRNVGVDTVKPDTHVRRILGKERLAFSEDIPTEKEVLSIIEHIGDMTGYSLSYIDAILWVFCSESYANICGSEPKCELCRLKSYCQR